MEQLEGKVAFITGGSSGIGFGMAVAFARAGMRVAVSGMRQPHLDEIVEYFAEQGLDLYPVRLDVTDRDAMERTADEIEHALGPVQLLANNAGIGVTGPVGQARPADWDWMIDVNIKGVVNGVQTFLPRMQAHGGGGHIVNTASMSGILPHPRAAIYIMTKMAVVGLSEALHSELAGTGIGVSAFCPGPVRSNIGTGAANRPAQYADSGYPAMSAAPPVWKSLMDNLEVGERVLRGVRHNDMFILTHAEFRDGTQARCDALMASFPDEEPNAARANEFSFLISNPIYETVGLSLE
jgi:NAD(P)-dependent dehydrogenase (short-subunit alcohol dehydrogenase family)